MPIKRIISASEIENKLELIKIVRDSFLGLATNLSSADRGFPDSYMISYICYVKDYKLGLSVLVVAILATAAVAEMANNYAINTSTYLVNQTGFTLYYFKMDPGNGTSTCSGGCVTLWPPFYTRKGLKN